jgi:hypothetical protein
MDLYVHSTIFLDGLVPNYLSTGTTLPFTQELYVIEIRVHNDTLYLSCYQLAMMEHPVISSERDNSQTRGFM